jgi:hypothetical protein
MAQLSGHGVTDYKQVLDLDRYLAVLRRKPGALTGMRPQQQWGRRRCQRAWIVLWSSPQMMFLSLHPVPALIQHTLTKVTVNPRGAKSDERWVNEIYEC